MYFRFRKPEISFAQNYFAEQTLSGVLYERGVDSKGFAVIRAKCDRALFGIGTAMMKRRVGAPEKRPLADFLSTIAIKGKDLAAEMTSVNVQQKDLRGQVGIVNNRSAQLGNPGKVLPDDVEFQVNTCPRLDVAEVGVVVGIRNYRHPERVFL